MRNASRCGERRPEPRLLCGVTDVAGVIVLRGEEPLGQAGRALLTGKAIRRTGLRRALAMSSRAAGTSKARECWGASRIGGAS